MKTDPYSKLLGKEYTGQRELILPQGIYGIMIYIIPSSKIVAGLEFHINPELPDYKQNRAYFNLINNIIPSLLKRYGGIYEKEYEKPTDTIFNRIDRLTINDVVVEAKSTFIQLENFHSFKVTIPSLMNRYKYEIDKYEIKQKEVQNKKAKEQMFE